MTRLSFDVVGARAIEESISPAIGLELRVRALEGADVRSILLRALVRLDARRRGYDDAERRALEPIFGARASWERALGDLRWTQATMVVPPLAEDGSTVELELACTGELAGVIAAYAAALREGSLPLTIHFSGTIFIARGDGALTAAPISWDSEARCELPLTVWSEAVARHGAALSVRRDLAARLDAVRAAWRLPTIDDALERLLDRADGGTV